MEWEKAAGCAASGRGRQRQQRSAQQDQQGKTDSNDLVDVVEYCRSIRCMQLNKHLTPPSQFHSSIATTICRHIFHCRSFSDTRTLASTPTNDTDISVALVVSYSPYTPRRLYDGLFFLPVRAQYRFFLDTSHQIGYNIFNRCRDNQLSPVPQPHKFKTKKVNNLSGRS